MVGYLSQYFCILYANILVVWKPYERRESYPMYENLLFTYLQQSNRGLEVEKGVGDKKNRCSLFPWNLEV